LSGERSQEGLTYQGGQPSANTWNGCNHAIPGRLNHEVPTLEGFKRGGISTKERSEQKTEVAQKKIEPGGAA